MPNRPFTPERSWWQSLHRRIRQRSPARTHHLLGHNNIYVAPSAAGYVLAATLLILLVASINFQLNLGYALTFLITGSTIASLWMAHRNLRSIELRLGPLHPVFQGERATVPVILQSMHSLRERHAISLALHRTPDLLAWVHTDIPKGQTSTIELAHVPHQRGWHLVPSIALESRFPLGVFRLWSYWQPDGYILVYPAPEANAPPIRSGDAEVSTQTRLQSTSSNAEPDGVRSYQRGDTMHSIVWKKAATALATGSGDLVVRSSTSTLSHTLWLDAHATGLSDTEAQIARLTAWVLYAHDQHWQWGLKLPSGQRIDPASDSQHLRHCLTALAVDSLPQAETSNKLASSA